MMDFEGKPMLLVPFEHTFLMNVLTKNEKYVTYFCVT
jgi:hypothetical protein